LKTADIIKLAVIGAALLAAGCAGTLRADENGIVIELGTHQPGAAQWQADMHCRQYGKKAVLVQKSPKQTTFLLESNVSEFECVP
jgi:hypothetical protein